MLQLKVIFLDPLQDCVYAVSRNIEISNTDLSIKRNSTGKPAIDRNEIGYI